MRNLLEVLREKETDLARVRQEVEALRFVAPLLFDRNDQFRSPPELPWSGTSAKESLAARRGRVSPTLLGVRDALQRGLATLLVCEAQLCPCQA